MTKDDAADKKLQWHPAFVQAMQAELFDYREHLEFRHEFQLNAAPLQIDLLIIKKPRELTIDKNIARIFRTDNLLEYKSPEDYLSVSDFWKVCAYANLYAATTPGVDLADVTLTFVGSRHPRKLLRYLTNTRGYREEETSPGIYLVTGDYLPIQIIESQNLPGDENLWLNSLREDVLRESSLDAILEEGEKLGQEINMDAYLDIILRANQRTFKEVYNMKKYPTLETILTEVGFLPEIVERSRVQGVERTVQNLLARNMPIEEIAQVTELPVEKIRSLVR